MRWALPLLAAAWLAGCATPPRAPGDAAWTSGRLSVRVEASAAQIAQGVSAAFELRGSGHAGELRLLSPLGTRLAAARWSPGQAVLETPQGEQRYGSLAELSRQALGEDLPLEALPDWVAGRPWAGAEHRPTDTGFEQLGWQVVLTARDQGLIEARREAPPGVTVRLRLD